MAAAPNSGAQVATGNRWGAIVRVVKDHPLMLTISILGTVATFIVATARLTGLVVDATSEPIGETIAATDVTLPAAGSYEYVSIEDESGQISVEVPTVWGNVLGNGWHARNFPRIPAETLIGPGLNAASSVDAWSADRDFETPGVFIGASQEILDEYTPEQALQQVSFDGCRTTQRKAYTNAEFTGAIVTWTCPEGVQWRVLAATPTESRGYLVYVQAKLVTSADVEAYNKILNTFDVDFDS